MKRIVVFCQPGDFGRRCSAWVAERLAGHLGLPVIAPVDTGGSLQPPSADWIAISAAGAVPETLLRRADTVIWLHYSPLTVAREWLRALREGFRAAAYARPGLADIVGGLLHMAWTPHVHQLLQRPSLAHLHVFHLRNSREADFWLRTQRHRLAAGSAPAQPA